MLSTTMLPVQTTIGTLSHLDVTVSWQDESVQVFAIVGCSYTSEVGI
jgi:hypothetical protein